MPQLFADVDKDKALKEGVAIGEIYNALQTFLGGSYINDFTRFGRQWRVFLQAEPAFRTRRKTSAVLRPKREGRDGAALVVREREDDDWAGVHGALQPVSLRRNPGCPGARVQLGTSARRARGRSRPRRSPRIWATRGTRSPTRKSVASGGAARVLGLSLVFVFLILAALYESWSLPFSVLLSIPVAVLGAYIGLISRNFDNNVYAQIGLVMLVGLTAKNAILIVEFAKDQLEQGRSIIDAALEGAKLRLRPILMTSFAFIFGCVPLWIATGAGAAARRMLGTAVISGMLAATLLGIFFIPALFVAVERLSRREAKAAQPSVDVSATAEVESPAHAE